MHHYGPFSTVTPLINTAPGLNLESPLVVLICHKTRNNTGVFSRGSLPGVECCADVWFRYEGL